MHSDLDGRDKFYHYLTFKLPVVSFILTMCVVVIIVCVLISESYNVISKQHENELKQKANSLHQYLEISIKKNAQTIDAYSEALTKLNLRVNGLHDQQVILYDNETRVHFDNNSVHDAPEKLVERHPNLRALELFQVNELQHSSIGDKAYVSYIRTLTLKDATETDEAGLFLLIQAEQVSELYLLSLKERGFIVGTFLALGVLLLSLIASRKLTESLTAVVHLVQDYMDRGKTNRLTAGNSGEIGLLTNTFARMIEEIESRDKAQAESIDEAQDISAQLQSVLSSMADAVININEQGKILAFNHAAEKIFGYEESEIIGQNISLLMPEEYASKHDNFLKNYLETGRKYILDSGKELPAVRKDGDIFPMYLSVSEIETGGQRIFTGLIRDITATKLLEKERKHMLSSAKELAWRLDFALASAEIGVWDYDLPKNKVTWNNRMFELYGTEATTEELPNEIWKKALHKDDLVQVENALYASIKNGEDFNEIFRVILPNKHVNYIEARAKVLYDENGNTTRVVGTNRDITEQHHLHDLKQQALDMAEDSLKLKSEFLASMSHEIRTPMNGVLGMLGLLEQSHLDSRQMHYVQLASSSANSLLTVINDILDFSKIESGKLDLEVLDFDLCRQLGEVAESLAVKAQEKGIEMILDVTNVREPLVKGDPTRIRQIVSNLVSNAIKFTEQGEIIIKASLKRQNDNKVLMTCSVSDSGIGIAQNKIAGLFDSFTQVDASTTRKYGGTGLGLAIVKQLCELMSGSINVKSEEGKGSVFEFTAMLEASEGLAISLPLTEIAGIHVLIVDDNETNLEVLEGQLTQWGALVSQAKTGKEALNIVNSKPENYFDIAILDMQMPEMDGATLGKAIKESSHGNTLKLIMMTSMGMTGDAAYFASIGFSAYFPKPATNSDLLDALRVVLDDDLAFKSATPLVTHQHLQTLVKPKLSSSVKNNIRILIVEDNRINQAVVTGILDSYAFETDIASDGEEALDKLEQAQEKPFNLILMDCQMPIMDGYQATKAIRAGIRKIDREIPIVAMTANAMKGDREKCLESGMTDYVAKPIDNHILLEKIELLTSWSSEKQTEYSEQETVDKKSLDIVWDEQGLSKRVRNNRDLAKKLVKMFMEDSQELLNLALTAVENNDFQQAASVAHKVKGTVRNLGGVKLGKTAHELEEASKAKDQASLVELSLRFHHDFDEFVTSLTQSALLKE